VSRRFVPQVMVACRGPLGGWGAKRTEDGVCATVCMKDGDTLRFHCRRTSEAACLIGSAEQIFIRA